MSQQKDFKTVAQVVLEALDGDEIEAVVVHKHRFWPDVGFRASPKLGNSPNDKKLQLRLPQNLLDKEIGWEQLEPYLRYDETFGRTVNFTIWSKHWILEHRWVIDSTPNCGGRVVRFRKISRHPTAHNPMVERFPGCIDTDPTK